MQGAHATETTSRIEVGVHLMRWVPAVVNKVAGIAAFANRSRAEFDDALPS